MRCKKSNYSRSLLIFAGISIAVHVTMKSYAESGTNSYQNQPGKTNSPIHLTEAECKDRGGHWAGDISGRGRLTGCVLATKDAGKKCTDSSECESVCLSRTKSLNDGRCYEWNAFKGCGILVVEKGKRTVICID